MTQHEALEIVSKYKIEPKCNDICAKSPANEGKSSFRKKYYAYTEGARQLLRDDKALTLEERNEIHSLIDFFECNAPSVDALD